MALCRLEAMDGEAGEGVRLVRILIIEDDPKTVAFLVRGLTESGYITEVARDGEVGLFLALEKSFDLIVCDIMLPAMDGWKVVSGIREANLAVHNHLPDGARRRAGPGSKGSISEPTTTWSSRSRSPSSWPGFARCSVVVPLRCEQV